ncbi:hypothetical protein FN846DRAFT_965309 [Sphaerosporella brunnea]|uniref:LysM domain-containing protein n=1 Tax=Sphaerosporella brunnea TaxID=1250544 RepID=A0A5J5EMA0_9PEZI|nr:hypothetical protein FN846DRAFT_965309 [Sphaerosporella brunnea]
MKSFFCAIFVGVELFRSAAADSFFFPNRTDLSDLGPDVANVSSGCVDAMLGAVNCDSTLITFMRTDYYAPIGNSTLQEVLCAPACGTSLSSYIANVSTACANDPQPYPGLPATHFGEWAYSTYNLTCLEDQNTGQYCTDYLSALFANSTTDQSGTGLPQSQLCSSCVIQYFRQVQGTPYSNYDSDLASQWSEIQSQCGLSYPTAIPTLTTNVTSLPNYAAPGTAYTGGCGSGNYYTVVSGDNCQVIAQKENVATGSLIILNGLLPDCSDLLLGATICLPQTCQTYQPVSGDTCAAIALANNITYPQLLAFNPFLNDYCTNLIAGTNICLSPPGGATWTGTTIAGATVTQTAIYASTTVAPPGAVASGTTRDCGRWYEVQAGDYCQLVALNQTIALGLFEQINPSIDSSCSNLLAGVYYCVQPTSDWNATSTSTVVTAPTNEASGTTDECYEYYTIQSGDYCALLENRFGITFAQFQLWNPEILNDCSNLQLDAAYCVNGVAQPSAAAKVRRDAPVFPEETGEVVRNGMPIPGGGVPVGWPYPLFGRGGVMDRAKSGK